MRYSASAPAANRRSPIWPPISGTDEDRLGRTIVRINTIEATSAAAGGDAQDANLPPGCVPSAPPSPDERYVTRERRERLRAAMGRLQPRDRRLLSLYYFQDATMKQIGQALGVNESRISQLHARAMTRLKEALPCGYADNPSRMVAALVDLQEARTLRAVAPDAVLDAATPKGKLLAYPTMSRTTRRSSRAGTAWQARDSRSRRGSGRPRFP